MIYVRILHDIWFSLTRFFPYKDKIVDFIPYKDKIVDFIPYNDKIVDFIPMWEKTGQRKPAFLHILCNAAHKVVK